MSMSATNSATLPSVTARVSPRLPGACPAGDSPPSTPASAGSSTSASTVMRSSTTSQPTAMRPSSEASVPCCSSARSSTTVLATDSARPKSRPEPSGQPHRCAMPAPSAVATSDLRQRPGNGDAPDRQQVAQREVRADTEHEQHHADLRQLRREVLVGDQARRVRAEGDAGEQVADQRRHAQRAPPRVRRRRRIRGSRASVTMRVSSCIASGLGVVARGAARRQGAPSRSLRSPWSCGRALARSAP